MYGIEMSNKNSEHLKILFFSCFVEGVSKKVDMFRLHSGTPLCGGCVRTSTWAYYLSSVKLFIIDEYASFRVQDMVHWLVAFCCRCR